jgi:hypothetical protein
MDIVSQLQEQVNLIAHLASNTVGTLQWDAPSSQLSPNYPEPPAHTTSMDSANFSEQPKLMASTLMKAAKQVYSILFRSRIDICLKKVKKFYKKFQTWKCCIIYFEMLSRV